MFNPGPSQLNMNFWPRLVIIYLTFSCRSSKVKNMFNRRSLINVIWVGFVSFLFREKSFFLQNTQNLGKMTSYFILSSIIKLIFHTEVKRH